VSHKAREPWSGVRLQSGHSASRDVANGNIGLKDLQIALLARGDQRDLNTPDGRLA